MRVLVAGWFSFEGMGATAGDLLCRDVVGEWLRAGRVPHDVAVAPPFPDGIDWRRADPLRYTHVIFVCGPFGNGRPVDEFLWRFSHAALIGLNLSMLDRLENWNPFDLLLERDSDRAVRPDLTFLAHSRRVPVVGVILAHRQKEYGSRSRHEEAATAIDGLLASHEAAVVRIDTRLDENRSGLRTPAEVETLIARMDVVLTTRLHGTVLALKNGVPAIAIDPIAGGAKVARQARVLDWPHCFLAESIDPHALDDAFEACLAPAAREHARRCADRARDLLADVRPETLAALERVGQLAET